MDAESLKKALKDRQSGLVSLSDNLVDTVWGSDRPARTLNPVFPLSIEFSGIVCDTVSPLHADRSYPGQSHEDKLAAVRKELKAKNLVATVLNALDDVAWLFNLRGSDIDYNPGADLSPRPCLFAHFTPSLLCICCRDCGFRHSLRERIANRRGCAKTPRFLRQDPVLRIVLPLSEGAEFWLGKGTQTCEFGASLPRTCLTTRPQTKANLDQ